MNVMEAQDLLSGPIGSIEELDFDLLGLNDHDSHDAEAQPLSYQPAVTSSSSSSNNHAVIADNPKTLALLYGCSHCLDLHQRLISQGYRATTTEWRTAWTVSPLERRADATTGATQDPETSTTRITATVLLVLLPIYFAVGGLDWIATLGGMSSATSDGSGTWAEPLGDAVLYLGRHVLLYVGLSRILLDWEESPN
mmetsp:Transcript_20019/g.47835  ORF Transcript_20019/g.47835 Transcript_20019/m.47835 type:complete len:196 (+) Transcript_20019:247-834(+)